MLQLRADQLGSSVRVLDCLSIIVRRGSEWRELVRSKASFRAKHLFNFPRLYEWPITTEQKKCHTPCRSGQMNEGLEPRSQWVRIG